MQQFKILFVTLLAAICYQASAQTPCSVDNLASFGSERLKIIPVSPNGQGVKRNVGGTFQAKDGCAFSVTNITLSPPGRFTYWYGIAKGQDPEKMYPQVVKAKLGTYNGQDINFKMESASWSDLDGLALYDEEDFRIYGKVLWPGVVDIDTLEDSAVTSKESMVALSIAALVGLLFF